MSEFFRGYDFGLSDSKRRLEILVGWKRARFAQALYTQRREFDAKNPNLRPGALCSVRQTGEAAFHNFLFLHTDSGRRKTDYDNRQAMFKKIWKLGVGGNGVIAPPTRFERQLVVAVETRRTLASGPRRGRLFCINAETGKKK